MKNYVVGFLSMFDNCIRLKQIEANTPEVAVATCMSKYLEIPHFELMGLTMDELEQFAANTDASVSVIEVV